jgi:serine/threonine-protein kinase HipA
MTSEATPDRVYVWIWLPGHTEPVVAGVLDPVGPLITFTYGRSYLARADAMPLYLPELPLRRGIQRPLDGLDVAGCIRDAAPDAWGQRVILRGVYGREADGDDTARLPLFTYLIKSGSDRAGALDFQASATDYKPRQTGGTLEELLTATERFETGEPLSPAIAEALLHGSSIGGARPKATLSDDGRSLIAKFSSTTDTYPVVKAEAIAMNLARRTGVNVASTELRQVHGKHVLLVERFDRTDVPGQRRMFVSALTILQLPEIAGRYATYYDLADIIRSRFTDRASTLRELFARITFNVCVGNTDDHARNHAAFWDGEQLTLTPAFDICPQARAGGEAAQAMAIARDGFRFSQLTGCVDAAKEYELSATEAREIIDYQIDVIRNDWDQAADEARLTAAERQSLWGRQILNPFALYDY